MTDCYVGFNAAGIAVAAAVDRPEYRKDTAKSIAEWVRDGLTVERRSVEWVRAHLGKAPVPLESPGDQK